VCVGVYVCVFLNLKKVIVFRLMLNNVHRYVLKHTRPSSFIDCQQFVFCFILEFKIGSILSLV